MLDLALLTESFEYDAWATTEWLRWLGDERDSALVLSHLLGAQQIWLTRCQGQMPAGFPDLVATEESVETLKQAWIDLLNHQRHDPVIHYTRLNGEPLSQPVSQIAGHVLNHGTYHRGELRGLCRARGQEDFPDTDLLLFLRR